MGFCNSSRITELVSEIDAVLLKHKTSSRTKSAWEGSCILTVNTYSQFPHTFPTNPSKRRIYLCKIPTVITETLIV